MKLSGLYKKSSDFKSIEINDKKNSTIPNN